MNRRSIFFSLLSLVFIDQTLIDGEILYCSIHFLVDYPLWSLTYSTRAHEDYFRTNTILSSYIYRNIEGLNELYTRYRFPYASKTKNVTIQFFVHGMSMVTDQICKGNSEKNRNRLKDFCASNLNSDILLDLISLFADEHKRTSNNEGACLYYGLTSRKLKLQNNQGTALGWSWKGHLCHELQSISGSSTIKSGFNPKYSANVGVVTVSFDASDYSLNKGEMTFFHEIGHSMNADHDDSDEFKDRRGECNPTDDQGGSYLMFATSTEGLLPNNRAYSHCSLDTISKYTERLGRLRPKCLSTSKSVKTKCDGIYSTDEICDEHGMSSRCCTTDCKLQPGAVCSPSAGSCCQSSCQYYPSGHQCRSESDCKKSSFCSGSSSICLENDPSIFKADRTICGGGALLCRNGSCSLSICALHSLLPCQLKSPQSSLCLVACQQHDGSCLPLQQIDPNAANKLIYFPYGSLCNDNHGFCDSTHKCLPLLVDNEKNLIGSGLSSLLLTNYSLIFERYWWAFLLFVVIQIVLIPVILLYFHSHCIPSDNPFLQ